MKKKLVGLVVGKFCPLHYGHDHLISKALQLCDKLIIISYTSNDWYDITDRKYWLTSLYPKATVVVKPPNECPADDEDAEIHREYCYNILVDELNTSVQLVFSSEDYGDGFAGYLSARFGTSVMHVCVDKDRLYYPISGTQLRNKMDKRFVCPLVRNSIKPRVAILGGESSGKSTLATCLGWGLKICAVSEYGRELYDYRKGRLYYEDMLDIAREQIRREREACKYDYSTIICDTTPLTTLFYCLEMFNAAPDELIELAARRYDKVILLDNSIPFVQDGTRRDESFRNLGYDFYKTNLKEYFTPKSSNLLTRVSECIRYINE